MKKSELSLKDIKNVATWYEGEKKREDPYTEFVQFDNNTTVWKVDVFLYEVRQIRNLPPRPGYVEYTGVTVGARNIFPRSSRRAELPVKVLGEFLDAGLLNLRNIRTGQVILTHNFDDITAPEGRYYKSYIWGIKDGKNTDKSVVLTFLGETDKGEIIEREKEVPLK